MNEDLGLLDEFNIRRWETYEAYYRYELNREEKPVSRSLLTFLNLISANSKKESVSPLHTIVRFWLLGKI